MTKSYKMIVLLYMLERGPELWAKPVTPHEAASFFHGYLMEKEYRKRIDFSDKESRRLWDYNEPAVSQLIERMPMTKWSSAKGSMTCFQDGMFSLRFDLAHEHRLTLYRWTKEICIYRLHHHFERREQNQGPFSNDGVLLYKRGGIQSVSLINFCCKNLRETSMYVSFPNAHP